MASQIQPFLKRIRRYFDAYGQWRAILLSPLFLLSVAIASVSYGNWISDKWSALAQSLIPNLLGFSLGTYAILFSLMTSRLKRALKAVKNDQGTTYLDEINATFFHFIFVQVIALLWAFIYSGTALFDIMNALQPFWSHTLVVFRTMQMVGGLVGLVLLIYSIALIIAAALVVYRLALIVDPADE